MAITQQQRDQVLKLVAGLYNAAPGGAILSDLAQAIKGGVSMAELADILANTVQFRQNIMGGRVTTAQQVSVLMNNFGFNPDGVAGSPATLAAEFFTARINEGVGFGAIVLEAVTFLDTTTDPAFEPFATLLNNKALVASVHAENYLTIADVAAGQALFVGVTSTFPVTEAEAFLHVKNVIVGVPPVDPGMVFTLTAGEDVLTGTAGDDVFNALIDATGAQTLQSFDQINGAAGTDTLNATLNSSPPITPILNSVENVNIRSLMANSGINFASSSGVERVSVANSTANTSIGGAGAINNFAVNNQTDAVTVTGSTASSLNLSFNGFGTGTALATFGIDGSATSATINTTNSHVNVGTIATLSALSVEATGSNSLNFAASANAIETLTVSGLGSLTSDSALAGLKTLTSTAEGAISVTGLGAAFETATTGAGNDSITVANATGVGNISTGAGNDTVTLAGALKATAIIDLGAGDDELVLNTAPAAGVTLTGGEGRDTLATIQTAFTGITGFTAAQRANITGFEVLSITDQLANASTVNLAAIAGITHFVAAAGLGGAASVTGLGQNATVELAGTNVAPTSATHRTDTVTFGALTAGQSISVNGLPLTATASMTAEAVATHFAGREAAALGGTHKSDTTGAQVGAMVTFTSVATGSTAPGLTIIPGIGVSMPAVTTVGGTDAIIPALTLVQATNTAADVLNLKLNNTYPENNDGISTTSSVTHTVTATGVETLNVESTGTPIAAFTGAAGTADGVNNTLALTNNTLVTLNVTGDQEFTFGSAAGMTGLATIDASALSASATINAGVHVATSAALTIRGSATHASTLTGGATNDAIIGGAANDKIHSSAGSDTITLGGGFDVYRLGAAAHSTVTVRDTITDFNPNTVGQGTGGAVTSAGAAALTLRNGDVIEIVADIVGSGITTVNVAAVDNHNLATAFLNASAGGGAAGNAVNIALDRSTGNLLLDLNDNGFIDSMITLTGFATPTATINAAAFLIV